MYVEQFCLAPSENRCVLCTSMMSYRVPEGLDLVSSCGKGCNGKVCKTLQESLCTDKVVLEIHSAEVGTACVWPRKLILCDKGKV